MKSFIISADFIVTFNFVFGYIFTYAQKVQIIWFYDSHGIVNQEKPDEFKEYLVSENGSEGVIVTPAESPEFGDIYFIHVTERRALFDIGHPGCGNEGIEPLAVFENSIINLPPEAWIILNLDQLGETGYVHTVRAPLCGQALPV